MIDFYQRLKISRIIFEGVKSRLIRFNCLLDMLAYTTALKKSYESYKEKAPRS